MECNDNSEKPVREKRKIKIFAAIRIFLAGLFHGRRWHNWQQILAAENLSILGFFVCKTEKRKRNETKPDENAMHGEKTSNVFLLATWFRSCWGRFIQFLYRSFLIRAVTAFELFWSSIVYSCRQMPTFVAISLLFGKLIRTIKALGRGQYLTCFGYSMHEVAEDISWAVCTVHGLGV